MTDNELILSLVNRRYKQLEIYKKELTERGLEHYAQVEMDQLEHIAKKIEKASNLKVEEPLMPYGGYYELAEKNKHLTKKLDKLKMAISNYEVCLLYKTESDAHMDHLNEARKWVRKSGVDDD